MSAPVLLALVGFFLIPFDNLPIAPSYGWATVSPYCFFLAGVLFILSKPELILDSISRPKRRLIIFCLIAGICSIVSYLIFPVLQRSVVNTSVKLILGISFFVCLVYLDRFYRSWKESALKLLLISYSISLSVGLFQIFLGNSLIEPLMARVYDGRIQFTFTEPSFVSLHIYFIFMMAGICISQYRFMSLTLASLGLLICAISVTSGSSLRVLLDLTLLAIILMLAGGPKIRMTAITLIAVGLMVATGNGYINARLTKTFSSSGVGDISAQVRLFRMTSAVNGYMLRPDTWIIGSGFGNVGYLMTQGYDSSLHILNEEYESISNISTNPDGVWSLPIKILSEHGFLSLWFIVLLFSPKYKLLFATLGFATLQMDSYAYYALWIYLYARRTGNGSDDEMKKALRFKVN